MVKNYFLIAGALLCISANAQKKSKPEAFAKTITTEDLKKNLSIIASAEMGGRDTPSPGLEKAADYIETQFKKYGVVPGNKGNYRQFYTLEKDSASYMSLNIEGMEFRSWEDYAPFMQMPGKTDLRFSEYVFVGYGIVEPSRDDYKKEDVSGKLVILMDGQPEGFKSTLPRRQSPAFIFNKISNAKKKGAAAVLVVTEKLPSQQNMGNAYRPKPTAAIKETADAIPVFFINNNIVSQSGQSIDDLKQSIGKDVVDPIIQNYTTSIGYSSGKKTTEVSNVIGLVEGTDKKDEYVFVTAHYDHVGTDAKGNIYYGADDDGSGTVGVMEMAEAFAKAKKEGKGPRRTVVFMLVSGEEKGLWGSEYYSENPIFPLEKTTVDLNIDMIGRVDTERMSADTLNYVYVIGHNKLSTDLQPISEGANNKYTKLVLDYKFDDPNDPNRIYYRSDHYNFARKGVPVLFFYDGMLKADYHKPTDTVDKINFPLLQKRTQMIFNTAWEMTNRNDMLKRDLKLDAQ
ncbi:MAG TPA: M28 family peptidase [Niabella sp.]|nr:M28 family peptidase [Niabella sp.]HQW15856.1 M28 family peptidase [Niabella sp.]HQX21068.1 M28 family peptidase [Niabella sp.]HQX40889.1 M28 family peptidase [Niabella sp.]HRB36897.1 M28 family peptidase [Niabella sp.]